MKPFLTCFPVPFFSSATLAWLAQTTISASDIIAKINRKEAISYQNATITGDLDLTSLANRKEVRDGDWGRPGKLPEYRRGADNIQKLHVQRKISGVSDRRSGWQTGAA